MAREASRVPSSLGVRPTKGGFVGALRGVGPWLLVLALAPEPTVALSIFDIIQLGNSGYTDKQIIALIESTASMFELEAEDLPRLKQLGITSVDCRIIWS